MAHPFLTTRWTHLVLANYRVPPELLQPLVPEGSELDTPDSDPGLHLLSLVAFCFSRTRIFGIPVPTAQNFPELNLRFYVRRAERRATVFLREYVPVPLIAFGARLLYNQPYSLAKLTHEVDVQSDLIHVDTQFGYHTHRGKLELEAANKPSIPATDSMEHFIKEHYWGFDRSASGKSFRYRVDHALWRTYPVLSAEVTIDPGVLLGGSWQTIDWQHALHSVFFAEGSAATIYSPEPLAR